MKDATKLSGLLFFGLLTAVIIYPFLHESGHAITAVVSGAEVIEFNMLPIPNVLCNMTNISNIGRAFIGLGGMIFPIAFSAVISLTFKKKNFWIGYVTFVLNCISLLAGVISLLSVISFRLGYPMNNEDVTQILQMYPGSSKSILIIMIMLMFYLITKIILDKPLKLCLSYFGIENNTKSGTS